METVVKQDDSSEINPSSKSSGDGNVRVEVESGRKSPTQCAICLGACENNCFTDTCVHEFCFNCLLTWSKVKAVCPLCKHNFNSIFHNVQPDQRYDVYKVEQHTQIENIVERIDIDNIDIINNHASHRFRYRTTLTLPRRSSLAIQQLLLHHPLISEVLSAPVLPSTSSLYPPRSRRDIVAFRHSVYRHNMWARPLPDFMGRFRDCSPEFYRNNVTQIHRLVPWLKREMFLLCNGNNHRVEVILAKLLELFPWHHIRSREFYRALVIYFYNKTEHFLHELYCFASTPYDLVGYDRTIQYTTERVNEVPTSSESDSADSDVVMVPLPMEQAAGPSRVVPIETLSHSDTDDDEVMVVGYIKPPQERTPEVVDLLGSDSDVVLQEEEPRPPVRMTLTLPTRKRRNNTATTEDTHRATPSPYCSDADWSPRRRSSPSDTSRSLSPSYNTTDSEDSSVCRRRRRKSKKKSRTKSKSRKEKSEDSKSPTTSGKSKRCKLKSRTGKGVKSSKRRRLEEEVSASRAMEAATATAADEARPGTSGTSDAQRRQGTDSAGKSRRLKSVVMGVFNGLVKSEQTDAELLNMTYTPPHQSSDSNMCYEDGVPIPGPSGSGYLGNFADTDSDDDLPLNLSVARSNGSS